MRITNTQKNELAQIFKKSNLNLIDFDANGEFQEFRIKFKHDYFAFSIEKLKDDVFTVTVHSINRKEPYVTSNTWATLIAKFDTWAQQVYTELNSPTGWESFENTNFLNAEYEDLNAEFTETERNQTRESIKELKEKIKLLNLVPEKLEIIEKKLDSLSTKLDELNKFDWKSLFIGTVASLIMTYVVPAEASGMFWEYIKSSFNNLKIKS